MRSFKSQKYTVHIGVLRQRKDRPAPQADITAYAGLADEGAPADSMIKALKPRKDDVEMQYCGSRSIRRDIIPDIWRHRAKDPRFRHSCQNRAVRAKSIDKDRQKEYNYSKKIQSLLFGKDELMKKFRKLILGAVTAAAAAVMSLCAVPDGVLPGFSVVASAVEETVLTADLCEYRLDAGTYYLNTDITITNCLRLNGSVTIDLNGHTFTIDHPKSSGNYDDNAICLESSKSLTIVNSKTGGSLVTETDSSKCGIYMGYNDAHVTIDGAVLKCEGRGISGGGSEQNTTISVINGGVIDSPKISGYASNNVTVTGSTLKNCTVSGAVFSGATIENCTVSGSTIDSETVIKSSTVTNSTVGGEEVTKAKYDENGIIQLPVTYIGADGTAQICEDYPLVPSSAVPVTWEAGTYVVADDVTISGGVTLPADGTLNLILCDGKKLTVTNTSGNAIGHPNGSPINAVVNIFGQSGQTGKLTADGSGVAISVSGALNIYGGDIEATSRNAQGIFCNSITIVRGKVKASGKLGIYAYEKIIINGGNVTAVSPNINALYGSQGVDLRWTEPTDSISLTGRVRVGSISSYKITIADGKYFTDGNGGLYSGEQELTDDGNYAAAALESKTLYPACKFTIQGNAPVGVRLNDDGTVTPPTTNPVLTFDGWYTNEDLTGEKYNFESPVTTNTEFYGKYSVSYIGEDGQETSTDAFTLVTSSDTDVTWTPGTYVVADDVTINGGVVLPASSEVNLILCDGKTLTVTNTDGVAIDYPNGSPIAAVFNIFGQSGQTGKLTADGKYYAIFVAGALNIYGGDIEATSSYNQGIAAESVTIVRGKVKATGGADPAIEAYKKIIINGGNVTAVGSTTNFALFGHQGVELGWTKPTDIISLTGNVYVGYSSYNITIADGKYFTDGNGGLYSGVLELTDNDFAAAALENKTLVPAYKMTFTADDVDDFYGGAPRTTGKVTKPELVTIDGKVVMWYRDNDCTEKFDFANTVITEDTTIYGKAEELTKIPAKAETCTAAGNKEYYKDSDGNLYAKDGEVYKETTLSAVTTAALGHSYKDGKCTRCDAADPDYKEPEPDNGGNNGNGGNSGSYTPVIPSYPSGGSTTTPTNTNEPKSGSGASGWGNITSEIGKTPSGGTVTVDMNGTTTVPANVLNALKGKDIDLVLDMGGGITWTINGKDIESVSGSIDLGVKLGTSDIPIDVVNNVTNEKYSTTLHLNHSGKFGFKAVMTVPLRKQDAGLFANLYYYNPSKKALEFVSSAKIDKNGNAELDFNHASDYAIVIDDHPLGGRDVTAKTNGSKVKLTWDAAPGAESYTVYIKKNDKYKEFKTTSKASLTVSGLKNGKTYEFLIRYSVDGKLSELADSYKVSVTAKYKPIVSLTADEGSITISWSKVENAEKYKVFKYVNGKLRLVTETAKRAICINGTKAGKEYSYAVKAYVDGKWTTVSTSDIVTVKAK